MANALTLRIMQRIVDKELGPAAETMTIMDSYEGQGHSHLSQDEEGVLKQLIDPVKQRKPVSTSRKKDALEHFAGTYNKGPEKSVSRSRVPRTDSGNKMNLEAFVQSKRK